MNDLSTALLPILWRASWQGALTIALVWCVCRATEQRIPASLRCTLYRLTYLKLLLGLLIAGGFALPLLRPASPEVVAAPTAPIVAAVPAIEPASSLPSAATVEAPTPTPYATPVATVAADPTSPNAFLLSWQSFLAAAYGVGLLICLIRLARALLRTRNILRSASPIDESDNKGSIAILHELALTLGLRRIPRLASSAAMTSPAYVAGTVLLPAGAEYSPNALRLILAHELAHVCRRDLTYEWLGVAAQTLFFFHPLVYLARREERLARESAADALALQATAAPAAALGKLLLDLAQRPHPLPSMAAMVGSVEGGTLLRRRLQTLKMVPAKTSIRAAIALILGGLCLLVPYRVTSVAAQASPPITPVAFTMPTAFTPPPRLMARTMLHGSASIVGQVRDDAGKPVGNVVVVVRQWRDRPDYYAEARADSKGNYAIDSLPAGHFVASLQSSDTQPSNIANHRYATTNNDFTLTKTDTNKTVNILASQGVTISGRILDKETGQPIAHADIVGGVERNHGRADEARDEWRTDASGRYFLRLPADKVFVRLLDSNTTPAEKRMTLARGQSVTQDFTSIALTFLNPDGTPAQGAQVHVSGPDDYDATTTDDKGQIRPPATSGSFRVTFRFKNRDLSAIGHYRLKDGVVTTAVYDAKQKSEVPGGSTVRLSESPGASDPVLSHDKSITGVVRSGETGKPLDVAITVETEDKGADGKPVVAFTTRSDAAGNFAVTQIPAGRYKVSIDDYTETSVELTARDTTKKVSLSYTRPATISGKFTKANGKPNGGIAMMGWTLGKPSDQNPPNQQNVQNVTIRYTGWEDGRYKMELRAGDVIIGSYSGELDDGRGKKSYLISNGKRLHLAPGQTATLDFAIDQTRTHR